MFSDSDGNRPENGSVLLLIKFVFIFFLFFFSFKKAKSPLVLLKKAIFVFFLSFPSLLIERKWRWWLSYKQKKNIINFTMSLIFTSKQTLSSPVGNKTPLLFFNFKVSSNQHSILHADNKKAKMRIKLKCENCEFESKSKLFIFGSSRGTFELEF